MDKIEARPFNEKQKKNLKSRVIVALILCAIFIPSVILGGWFFFGAISAIMVASTYEMMHATGKKYPWWIQMITYVIVICFVYWFFFKGNLAEYTKLKDAGIITDISKFDFELERYFATVDISWVGVSAAIGAYFLIAVLYEKFTFIDAFYFIVFTIVLGLGGQAILFCRYYPFNLFNSGTFNDIIWFANQSESFKANPAQFGQPWFKYGASMTLLFFVLIGVMINDIMAYFVGSIFGKHKMNPRISPNKSWEGFFGGWFFGTAAAIAFGLGLAFGGYPMLPTLGKDTWYWVVLLAVVLPLLGDLGDLSFSMIKRHFGIKDYSHILGGHGGIIDRVGSVFVGAIGTWIILVFITNGWNFLV